MGDAGPCKVGWRWKRDKEGTLREHGGMGMYWVFFLISVWLIKSENVAVKSAIRGVLAGVTECILKHRF